MPATGFERVCRERRDVRITSERPGERRGGERRRKRKRVLGVRGAVAHAFGTHKSVQHTFCDAENSFHMHFHEFPLLFLFFSASNC